MTKAIASECPQGIAITGIGVVTPLGFGAEAQTAAVQSGRGPLSWEELAISDFDPSPHISQRKWLRMVSRGDAIGLAAVEDAKRSSRWGSWAYDPCRVGLYVGASPLEVSQYESYRESVEATKGEGHGPHDVARFGVTAQSARPNTLLLGLVNNVLCYGAIALDSRGANSNYMSLDIAGQVSVIQAAKAIRRRKLDAAMAGGYSTQHDALSAGTLQAQGYLSQNHEGKRIANGAAFWVLEDEALARKRSASVLATYLAGAVTSDGSTFYQCDPSGEGRYRSVMQALAEAGLTADAISYVISPTHGSPGHDAANARALNRLFESVEQKPLIFDTRPIWGSLTQAQSLAELSLIHACFNDPTFLPKLQHACAVPETPAKTKSTICLFLSSTLHGDYSSILLKFP